MTPFCFSATSKWSSCLPWRLKMSRVLVAKRAKKLSGAVVYAASAVPGARIFFLLTHLTIGVIIGPLEEEGFIFA